jgi:hypothetical protein
VAANGVDLRDHGHVRAGVERLDRGAHARTAGADDEDVVLGLHGAKLHKPIPGLRR